MGVGVDEAGQEKAGVMVGGQVAVGAAEVGALADGGDAVGGDHDAGVKEDRWQRGIHGGDGVGGDEAGKLGFGHGGSLSGPRAVGDEAGANAKGRLPVRRHMTHEARMA